MNKNESKFLISKIYDKNKIYCINICLFKILSTYTLIIMSEL